MKGTIFNKPLEWNIETVGESWQQGDTLKGTLKVKNHGNETIDLTDSGVCLAYAEIKKVHSRTEGALKIDTCLPFDVKSLAPGTESILDFSFTLTDNAAITDKKSSHYLGFGKSYHEGQLQVKLEPKSLYLKVIGLMDTFQRFKVKDIKATKKGVEYKLIPPTSRDMANIDGVFLTFAMANENLQMLFDFQVKRIDTSSITTKVNKESVTIEKSLTPKDYSLGHGYINQDKLLKTFEEVLAEVKLKSVF